MAGEYLSHATLRVSGQRMDQNCLVLDLGHSGESCLKRVQISYRSMLYLFLAAVALTIGSLVLCSSYVHMTWKVSRYNKLAADFDRLRNRYQELERVSRQHNEQMASLETLASEVSVAYGLHEPSTGKPSSFVEVVDSPLVPTVKESIQEYNFLKAASFGSMYRRSSYQWQTHSQPTLWPINGILRSSFGSRTDPFSGEGTFHTGIDLAAPKGTPVHVTADGVVSSTRWAGGYGKLIVVDHGNGIQTYYAHLSRMTVMPGQEVHSGETIAYSGSTGHSTGPHMHYEIRLAGTPVNPYKYMTRSDRLPSGKALGKTVEVSHNDLGL